MHIPLTQGRIAVVDLADWPRVAPYTWCTFTADRKWIYAVTGSARCVNGRQFLHRLLLDAPPELQVDHIDHDGLNNRRANLRLVTLHQNLANARPHGASSPYRGVTWDRYNCQWMARVTVQGQTQYLGRFVHAAEAARAVDAALHAAWGPYACLNFPADLVHDQLG